jgi:hypothetical protein
VCEESAGTRKGKERLNLGTAQQVNSHSMFPPRTLFALQEGKMGFAIGEEKTLASAKIARIPQYVRNQLLDLIDCIKARAIGCGRGSFTDLFRKPMHRRVELVKEKRGARGGTSNARLRLVNQHGFDAGGCEFVSHKHTCDSATDNGDLACHIVLQWRKRVWQ